MASLNMYDGNWYQLQIRGPGRTAFADMGPPRSTLDKARNDVAAVAPVTGWRIVRLMAEVVEWGPEVTV